MGIPQTGQRPEIPAEVHADFEIRRWTGLLHSVELRALLRLRHERWLPPIVELILWIDGMGQPGIPAYCCSNICGVIRSSTRSP